MSKYGIANLMPLALFGVAAGNVAIASYTDDGKVDVKDLPKLWDLTKEAPALLKVNVLQVGSEALDLDPVEHAQLAEAIKAKLEAPAAVDAGIDEIIDGTVDLHKAIAKIAGGITKVRAGVQA